MRATNQQTQLTIVGRLPEAEIAREWLEPVLALWDGPSPAARVLSVRSLCDELAPHDPCEPGQRSPASQVVVVLITDDDDDADLYHLADALHRSTMPAVLVARGSMLASIRSAFADEIGAAVLDRECGPAVLARVIRSLLERQPLIDTLSREVRLAQLSQRSIAGELDKLHKELHEAAHMQRQFVQKAVPYVPGLNIGAVYRPATYVSGDLFDVERLGDHHVSVFLADAVGHGVPAAMLTLFISRALPKMDGVGGSARIVPPGEALARLNREFCGRPSPGGRFATAMYAVIDTRTMEVEIAGAGHPAAIVALVETDSEAPDFSAGVSEATPIGRIESEGALLGVFPDAEFDSTRVSLAEGRGLVMFTDGFETAFPNADARAKDLKMPTDGYIAHLAGLARHAGTSRGLADALSAFERELDGQIGSLHRPDDVTALIVSPDRSASSAVSDAA